MEVGEGPRVEVVLVGDWGRKEGIEEYVEGATERAGIWKDRLP